MDKFKKLLTLLQDDMTISIGNFLITEGTDSSDYPLTVTPGKAYLGKKGDDSIWIEKTAYLPFNGVNYWIPSLASGGIGNDRYRISYGASTIIADASNSDNDSVIIYDYTTNLASFFSIDNRHIIFSTSWGTNIVVLDALNEDGRIEQIEFMDLSLSGSENSIRTFLANYKTQENQTLEGLISQGFLNPKAMGVQNSNEIREIMNSVYAFNSFISRNTLRLDSTSKAADIVNQWFGTSAPTAKQIQDVTDTKLLDINASTWSDKIQINRVAKATDNGDILEALMPDLNADPRVGSVLNGGAGKDVISGRAGWDVLDGGDDDDLIHGGNGRDIISGGKGRDELHGDFGWNTYKSEKDGASDLIAIKSDQYLVNWIYGKAGNNADGSKCDIIEGLDAIDKIKIIGVDTRDITFAANVTAKGLTGIGIYGKGALEALYTGGDLTINQITQMTSGDASAAAMANQVNSYGSW